MLPEAEVTKRSDGKVFCPTCGMLLEDAVAKGCSFSSKACDLATLTSRVKDRSDEVQEQEEAIQIFLAKKPQLEEEVARAELRLIPLIEAVALLGRSGNKALVLDAGILLHRAGQLELLCTERTRLDIEIQEGAWAIKQMRKKLVNDRSGVITTIQTLSTLFDAVLKQLVPEVSGNVTLSADGLEFAMPLHGCERLTTALESLKVIAFDLAALAMSIERGPIYLDS